MEGIGAVTAKIDEFELLRRLGQGGMGEVWLARDTLLERDVAVKFSLGAMSDEARLRFQIEARAVARLQHPNILAVHHAGELRGQPFLVTELLHGKALDELGPLPPAEVVAIGVDLSRALAAAHAAGVVHRDIKPANAFLCDDGAAKLLDFGLAQLRDDTAAVALEETHQAAVGAADSSSGQLDATQAAVSLSGRMAGTPLYMAPETWRGESATQATDVYSLGALLLTLLTGRPPYLGDTMDSLRQAVLKAQLFDVAAAVPEAPAALVGLIARCLSLRPDARPAAEELCAELQSVAAAEASTGQDAAPADAGDPGGNPYRGLLSFGAEHHGLFFGREAEAASVLTELAGSPFVLVVGMSGAGKSSLVRAGVVPRVLAGRLGRGAWSVATMVPGERPIERLAQAIAPVLDVPEGEALAALHRAPTWAADRFLGTAGGGEGRSLLLLLDQFEECWTLSSAADRGAFFQALAALARVGARVRLVATLRADFLGHLDDLGELRAVALRAPVMLGPLSSDGLRRAIVEPARRRGVEVEPALADALVERARGATGMLPLLEFALGVLWERRDDKAKRVTLADLEALGGLEGALAVHADAALGRLPARLRDAAKRVLLALVPVERTRARREERELLEGSTDGRAALDALVDARLVVASAGEETTAYEVAHEVLLTGWPTLRGWLDAEAQSREARERLRRGVAEWERLGRAPEALWNARQLGEVEVLGEGSLSPDEARFVAESRAAVRNARLRRLGLRVGLPLLALVVASCIYGGLRWRERSETRAFVAARLLEAEAARREVTALEEQVKTARSEAFARYDANANDRRGGEKRWKEALALAKQESTAFAAASAPLGVALARDPRDPTARARAADLTYDWLLAAERDHDDHVAGDLTARLAQLDDDGSRRGRLAAPAHLRVTSAPGGASVVLHAVHIDAEGRRVEDEGHGIELGASLELPPGSYILRASAPGRYPTRFPVLLGRAEDAHVEIPLPASADVPEGFIFVPGGVSLLGAADVEGVRAALSAEPEHAVPVEPFLIGEHEVTYAEYLEYLSTLPAAEREARRPHAPDLDMTYDADGVPRLTLRKLTARRGEPLCRPRRSERRCQDWLRFPVAGVASEDAQAYAAWLGTRRVPGARLCLEREWERAARGADGRLFAGGDVLHAGEANFDATYHVDTEQMGADEVGSFSADRSPFGVVDLTGNVAEWVTRQETGRAARGGCWNSDSFHARAASRYVGVHVRYGIVGVRVCASVPRTRNPF